MRWNMYKALFFAVAIAAGCASSETRRKAAEQFQMGRYWYENGKFLEAKGRFAEVLRLITDDPEAMLYYAHSSRELGNTQYAEAERLLMSGKKEQAERVNASATEDHNDAFRALQVLLREDPEEIRAMYALGVLYYDRATSLLHYPYRPSDAQNRGKERDQAIERFRAVLVGKEDMLYARRYLALLLSARGEPKDIGEAKPHLEYFLKVTRAERERIAQSPIPLRDPQVAQEAKKRKMEALDRLDRELQEMEDVLSHLKGGGQ